MHLLTIIAFALLFWRSDGGSAWLLVPDQDTVWSITAAVAIPLLSSLLAALGSRRTLRLIAREPAQAARAQTLHHRHLHLLRGMTILAFAALVLATRWPDFFRFGTICPPLQIVGDLVVLTPFLLAVVLQWVLLYRVDRALRCQVMGLDPWAEPSGAAVWPMRRYLEFYVRHHILVVAVPMTLVLFAANMTTGYGDWLRSQTGWAWTPDTVLGATALAIFLLAPAMLRRIWRTRPLEAGPVKEKLEALGGQIGLRFRRILVWESDGLMINAAVMGIIPQVRYVMLSDALLASMTPRQIAAVFGHEAGHVRHHHIQYFLLFAIVGWVLVAGLMEGLARWAADGAEAVWLSAMTIQGLGVLLTVLLWGVGFGWISRRFERHADVFGARCVTPDGDDCSAPCSVHGASEGPVANPYRLCATGASVFISALERVAALNGIPHEERSWRHSSIGSRIRHLVQLAGDPRQAATFESLVRMIMRGLIIAAVLASVGTALYCIYGPTPALLQLNGGSDTAHVVSSTAWVLAAVGAWMRPAAPS